MDLESDTEEGATHLLLPSIDEMQQRRSPAELHEYVEMVRGEYSTWPPGIKSQAMLHRSAYKQFIEELIPLARFVRQLEKTESPFAVEWKDGSQGWDASLYFLERNERVGVELTIPHNGERSFTQRKEVVDHGYSTPDIGKPGDDFEALIEHVMQTCADKAGKDYGGAYLVIAISPLAPFEGFEASWKSTLDRLVGLIRKMAFRADRVYLLVMPERLIRVH